VPTLVAPRPRHDRGVPEADALIAEARARQRRRQIVSLFSIVLAAATVGTWLGRDMYRHSGNHTTVVNAQLTAEALCTSAMNYGPLPVWARAGFHPANMEMSYVLGAHDDIVAVLWARQDPLHSPPKPDRGNKILWVPRVPVNALGNLQIAARRFVGGTAVGPVVRRTVIGGPGPSLIDMPQAGCWQFTLRWPGHEDSVDLAYSPSRG
jgi:hypothetical protein